MIGSFAILKKLIASLLYKEGAADSLISYIKFRLTANRLCFMLNAEMVHQVLAAGTQLRGFLFLCLGLQVQVGEVTNSYTEMKITVFKETLNHIYGIIQRRRKK